MPLGMHVGALPRSARDPGNGCPCVTENSRLPAQTPNTAVVQHPIAWCPMASCVCVSNLGRSGAPVLLCLGVSTHSPCPSAIAVQAPKGGETVQRR